MGALKPVAFDIETTGFDPESTLTVAGVATDRGAWQVLNTAGREANAATLERRLAERSDWTVTLETAPDQAATLAALETAVADRFDPDRHYVCGFNGETWRQGFDLPFLRTVCARADLDWPFPDFAYADVRSMVDRFNTGEAADLVAVHETLVGTDRADPFTDSAEAVTAFEAGDWAELLRHNLADLRRTVDLAVLAGRYVPKSDFDMKNLGPPAEQS